MFHGTCLLSRFVAPLGTVSSVETVATVSSLGMVSCLEMMFSLGTVSSRHGVLPRSTVV